MINCINHKHHEIQELSKQLKLHPAIVAAKVALWQDSNNNMDRFPTIDELTENTKEELNKLEDNSKEEIFYSTRSENETTEEENVDYYALNNQLLFGNKQGKFTVDEILNNIANSDLNLSDAGKILIEKAQRLMNKSGTKVQFVHKFSDENTVMAWDSNTNTLQINKNVLSKYTPEMIAETFIHEVAHSTSAKAYLNPSNFEEAEFRLLIDDMFDKYKSLSNNSKSYGFSNPMEFIAELYSNKEFQIEVKSLNSEDGFWRKFIDAVRRLFGLKKTSEYDNLINNIVSVVESDQTNYRGEFGSGLFYSKREATKKPDLTTLEKRLVYNVNVAKDRLEQALARAKKSKKSTNSKKENKEFIKNLEELVQKMNEYSETENWKSLLLYTKALSSQVFMLQQSLDKKDFSKTNILNTIYHYDNYLATYDMLDEIKQRIAESRIQDVDDDTKEVVNQIRSVIEGFESKHSELVETFKVARQEGLTKLLANPIILTEVETRNRKRLEKEYTDNKVIGETKEEYVTRMMQTRDKERIENELLEYSRDIVTGISLDITKTAVLLFDPLNTNSKLISSVVNIIANIRNRILNRFNEENFKLGNLFDEFIKDRGNKKPSELYKNLYEQDKDGNYYLKGIYTIKYRDLYKDEYLPLVKARKAIVDKYKQEGYESSEYETFKDYQEADNNVQKWLNKHTKGDIGIPLDKYLNDLSKLSEVEKKVLDKFTEITKQTNSQTLNKSSLIRRINTLEFYKLPSVTSSDFQRLLESDVKGLTKDKFEDWTKVRTDDVTYQKEAVDGKGNTINHVRVHYRGKLGVNQQSLDLFNIYRMELLNGINYQEKANQEVVLNSIAEASKDKKYIKNSSRTGSALQNVFSKREQLVTFDGSQSNEYKRIKGLIESNLYDVLHENAGTFAGADINKLTQLINKSQATIGMALNLASATANVLNGVTQLLIETAGGNNISKESLLKAEKKYTLDIPNILADLGNPVKKSFTNQVLEMFDTFGGFSPSEQEFLRNNILKKLSSTKTLTGLQEGGEHMLQSILTMGVLDNLKVMNSNARYINNKGEEVDEKNAASLLDMLKLDTNGKLYMDPNVAFTKQNMGLKYFEGGKVHVNLLIKKKIHDTMGAYDSNFQNELYKTWYGKMLMMFKRYLIPGLQSRWKGISSVHIAKEDLTEDDLIYNSALKEYEEGIYVSLGRFFIQGVLPTIKSLRLLHTQEYWNQMSDYEKANLKKATLEIVTTMALLPLLGLTIGAAQGDGDDEYLWFLNYQRRRLESEIAQYRNINEAWRITSNPIAGTRLLQNTTKVVGDILTPWSWNDEDSKGNNKLLKDSKQLIPIYNQLSKEWKQSYNFIERN